MTDENLEFMLRVAPAICDPTSALALAEQERTIERGLQSFIDIGRALAKIRDQRLYLDTYNSFEVYCQSRWQLSRPRAYELMNAATLVDGMSAAIEMSAIADTPLPSNEAQARELTGVNPADAVEIMAEVNEATDGKPTAKAIRDAVTSRSTTVIRDEAGEEIGGIVDDRDPAEMTEADWIDDAYDSDALSEEIEAEFLNEPHADLSTVAKPKRRPITEAFDSASYELRRAVERVVRLTEDDRLQKNRDQISGSNLSDLVRVRDAINGVINTLEG